MLPLIISVEEGIPTCSPFFLCEAMNATSCLPSNTGRQTPCQIPKKLIIYAWAPAATLAACWGLIFLPSLLKRTRGGGARLRRPSRERTLWCVSTPCARRAGGCGLRPGRVVFPGGGIPNDLAVDGARDAVLELQVHLGDGVLGEDGGIRDITCRSCISRRIRRKPEAEWRSKRSQEVSVGSGSQAGSTYG